MYTVIENDKIQLKSILKELSLLEKFENAKVIAIKPNFAAGTYIAPDSHVITNLERMGKLISELVQLNPMVSILLCESDSTGYGFAYEKFKHFNLPDSLNLDAEIEKHVSLVDMTRDELYLIENPAFKYFKGESKRLYISKRFMEADIRISFAVLKTHSVTKYTGACKNLFGCLPDFEKSHYHTHIHDVIHDLVLGINPDLSIVDAFYGMEQNGPCNGKAMDLGFMVFTNDATEADAYASHISGFKLGEIQYLKILCKSKNQDFKDFRSLRIKRKIQRPQLFLRFMNSIGLFLQRLGQGIANFGHGIHTCNSLIILLAAIARPILLKFFDIKQLRNIKRRIIK